MIDWIEKTRASFAREETAKVKTAIAVALLIAAVPASAQMLKCVGKDGKVEYAAQCPPGTKEQQTGIKNEPGAIKPVAPTQQKSLAEREADFRKRQTEGAETRQKDEKKAAETAQNQEACLNAKANLAALQEGHRVTTVDPKTGERVFVEDAQRPAEIARAQGLVTNNCK
jgi:hypothetical protein